jgi:uncharacterized protein (DUF924 family)
MDTADDVLEFWFGAAPGPRRPEWFQKVPLFDETIRRRFLPLHNRAAQGRLDGWKASATTALALVIVTDQFPRNLFRGSPRSFATDPIAFDAATHIIRVGWEKGMKPVEKMFVYLPFEHSENLEVQERSVKLLGALAGFPETSDCAEYSRRHWEIVKRFGRFPHRNAALGRASTPEEIEFLKQPGSGF